MCVLQALGESEAYSSGFMRGGKKIKKQICCQETLIYVFLSFANYDRFKTSSLINLPRARAAHEELLLFIPPPNTFGRCCFSVWDLWACFLPSSFKRRSLFSNWFSPFNFLFQKSSCLCSSENPLLLSGNKPFRVSKSWYFSWQVVPGRWFMLSHPFSSCLFSVDVSFVIS